MSDKLSITEFDDYLALVEAERLKYPSWRLGQAYFNVLHMLHEEIANELRGTHVDPFYNDGLIADFLVAVKDGPEAVGLSVDLLEYFCGSNYCDDPRCTHEHRESL